MRVWLASLGLALEPVLGSWLVRFAFLVAFYVFARLQVDAALKVPGVDSEAIFAAISIGFFWTVALAAGLCVLWAVPATVLTRISIARANRVQKRRSIR